MKDKRILFVWALGLIFELLVLWFVTKEFTVVTWITLAFTILAFVSQFLAWSRASFSNFLIYPGMVISIAYLIVQFVLCIVFGLAASAASVKITVFINLMPLVIVCSLLSMTSMSKEYVQKVDKRQKNRHEEI